jgi:hypothetical protein
VDLHHFDADPDADPDSTYHPYADPDSDFLIDADADADPTFHPDADPDPYRSFKKGSKRQTLDKVLNKAHIPYILA